MAFICKPSTVQYINYLHDIFTAGYSERERVLNYALRRQRCRNSKPFNFLSISLQSVSRVPQYLD
jgi:hypothetical protein